MVTGIAPGAARQSMPAQNRAFLDARDALESLRQPRKKTEAERRLDEVLQTLKTKKSEAAREAARRKIEQIKTKLNALKLAAGSAAATGDAKLARKVAKDIRDAARELGKALNEAGGSGSAAPVVNGNSDARAEQMAMEKARVERAQALANGNDIASLKSEAAGVATELKKIMRKLRETAFHPAVVKKDRAAMEKMLTESERELSGLQAAALPSRGGAVDLSA